MYLLDTNIISEVRKIKNNKANQGIREWFLNAPQDLMFINTVVFFELKKGILLAQHNKDFDKATMLNLWLNNIESAFDGRVLVFDKETALVCASLHVPNPKPRFDSFIAATALVHDLTLVTNNVRDFSDIKGLRIFNPFT